MGDVAMAVPVLRAFSKQHPLVKVTIVSREMFRPMFEGIAYHEFFAVDLKHRHKGILGLIRLFIDLKKLQIDAVADLHGVLRSNFIRTLLAISGKKTAVIDKGRSDKKALTRPDNKIFKPLQHTTSRYASVFEKLGFPILITDFQAVSKPEVPIEILERTSGKLGKWIGIAPFAKHQAKVYPQELMQKVIDELAANSEFTLFLFGAGEEEIKILNSFSSSNPKIIVVAGSLSFAKELHLIANLDLMLSMDSGNGHLAAMYQIPVVTLWGATHPFAGFAPFGQPDDYALVANREMYPLLPTSVYGNKVVAGYEDAMKTIAPKSVVSKIKSILK